MTSLKQVIIVRDDLKKFGITVGKLMVHIGHAAVEGYRIVATNRPDIARMWILTGQKKVVLHVADLDEMLKRYKRAMSAGLPAEIIRDAGLTELPAGTITVLVIGPWFSRDIDRVTGDLPLLRDW